jgi:hypothetical protein
MRELSTSAIVIGARFCAPAAGHCDGCELLVGSAVGVHVRPRDQRVHRGRRGTVGFFELEIVPGLGDRDSPLHAGQDVVGGDQQYRVANSRRDSRRRMLQHQHRQCTANRAGEAHPRSDTEAFRDRFRVEGPDWPALGAGIACDEPVHLILADPRVGQSQFRRLRVKLRAARVGNDADPGISRADDRHRTA